MIWRMSNSIGTVTCTVLLARRTPAPTSEAVALALGVVGTFSCNCTCVFQGIRTSLSRGSRAGLCCAQQKVHADTCSRCPCQQRRPQEMVVCHGSSYSTVMRVLLCA